MIQKYADLLSQLENFQLYTGGTIAAFAKEKGIALELPMLFRIRLNLNRYALANFPKSGDGMLALQDKIQIPGWFGWRWKALPSPRPGDVGQ